MILAEIERTCRSSVGVIDLGVDGDIAVRIGGFRPDDQVGKLARAAIALLDQRREPGEDLGGIALHLVSLLDVRLQEREPGPVAKRGVRDPEGPVAQGRAQENRDQAEPDVLAPGQPRSGFRHVQQAAETTGRRRKALKTAIKRLIPSEPVRSAIWIR